MITAEIRLPPALAAIARYGVTVTPEDIRDGIQGNCSRCPVALAATRAFSPAYPDLYDVLVSSRTVDIWTRKPGQPVEILACTWVHDAKDFITCFDNGPHSWHLGHVRMYRPRHVSLTLETLVYAGI